MPNLIDRAHEARGAEPIADAGDEASAPVRRRAPKRRRDPPNPDAPDPDAAPKTRPRRALLPAEDLWCFSMFEATNPAGTKLNAQQLDEIRQVGMTSDPPMLNAQCQTEHVRSAQRIWRRNKQREQARALALAQDTSG